MTRFEYITTVATESEHMNRQERAWFHYWNPAGAVSEWRAACDLIDAAVAAGKLRAGAILAYGSGSDYYERQLMTLVRRRSPPSVWDVEYHVKCLREAAAKAREKAR